MSETTTNEANQSEEGVTLTQEQWDEITGKSYLNHEPHTLFFEADPANAHGMWEIIKDDYEKRGVPMTSTSKSYEKFWMKKPHQCLAIIQGNETLAIQATALLSCKCETDDSPYYINLLLTRTPIMTEDFIRIMLQTLQQVSESRKKPLKIPERYAKFLTQ
jgi:hypothetical protein